MEGLTNKIKKNRIKNILSGQNTFETPLNGANESERQETLNNLGESDSLILDTFLNDEKVGFEVLTSDKKSLGIIPAKTSIILEVGMARGLIPSIIGYQIVNEENGILNCSVTLKLN